MSWLDFTSTLDFQLLSLCVREFSCCITACSLVFQYSFQSCKLFLNAVFHYQENPPSCDIHTAFELNPYSMRHMDSCCCHRNSLWRCSSFPAPALFSFFFLPYSPSPNTHFLSPLPTLIFLFRSLVYPFRDSQFFIWFV